MIGTELAQAINRIKEFEERQRAISARLRKQELALNGADLLEKSLVKKIPLQNVGGRIVGVDGSIVSEELQGLDLVLVRACAVAFDYEQSHLINCDYYPSTIPIPEVLIKYALENHEFAWLKSIKRLYNEVSIAIEAVKKFSPNFCNKVCTDENALWLPPKTTIFESGLNLFQNSS